MHVKVRVMSFMSGVICSSRLISKTFWKRCCVRTIRRWDMVFQTTSAVQWLKMLHLLQSLRRRGRQVHRRAEGSRLACSRRLLIFGGTVGQEDQPAQCNGGLKCFLCVSIPIMSISEAPAIWCHLMQFVYLLSLLEVAAIQLQSLPAVQAFVFGRCNDILSGGFIRAPYGTCILHGCDVGS